MNLSTEGILIIFTLAAGFVTHLFYFGRKLGELETTMQHLSKGFDEFRAEHFISRDEFESRHQDVIRMLRNKVDVDA